MHFKKPASAGFLLNIRSSNYVEVQPRRALNAHKENKMGRPLNKKYFGNTNLGSLSTRSDNFIGGEGVSTTFTISGAGSNYSQGVTLTLSAPQLPTGVTATASPTVNGSGAVTAITLTEKGSGYTSAPSVTINKPTTVAYAGTATNTQYTLTNMVSVSGIYVGMLAASGHGMQANAYVTAVNGNSVTLNKTMTASTASMTITFSDNGSSFSASSALTASQQNAIKPTAYISTGSSGVVADIIKQESTRKYLVKTAQGIGQCKLSTTALVPGTMWILATDVNGSSYYVTKLTAHKAYLTRKAMVGSYEYATGAVAKWNLSAAAAGNVLITNG